MAFFASERIEELAKKGCPNCGDRDHLSLYQHEEARGQFGWNENYNSVDYDWDMIDVVGHMSIECSNCYWTEKHPEGLQFGRRNVLLRVDFLFQNAHWM